MNPTVKDSVRKINTFHERVLTIFNELMGKDNSVSIQHKICKLQKQEMCKMYNNIHLPTLNDIFALRAIHYNLRSPGSFKMRKVHSVYNGTETPSHLGLKL